MNCFRKYFIILLLVLAAFCQPGLSFAQNPFLSGREIRPVSAEQTLDDFYRQKIKRGFEDALTYRDKSNAAAFAACPRVFWQDTIAILPPFQNEGALFTHTLNRVYAQLAAQSAPDTRRLAEDAVLRVIRSYRRVDAAREIPLPKQGDIWHQSLYLSSFYAQIADFAQAVTEQKAEQKERAKTAAWGRSSASAAPLPLAGLDENVFLRRQADIEAFVRAYTAGANAFVRQTLAPLQTSSVPGADIAAYLKARLNRDGVPAGLTDKELFDVLTEGLPSSEQCYAMARRANPSFSEQITSGLKVFTAAPHATWNDVNNILGMFEYISPGVLLERLQEYGKIPSRQETLDTLAAAFAADALEKRLTQIASDLFEFEKPFYYSYVSLRGAEEDIGKNWYAAATNNSFGAEMIARVASDNLVRSGRRQYQTPRLARALEKRQMRGNAQTWAKIIPFAADFAAGDLAFKLAAPVVKNSKAAVTSAQEWARGLKMDLASAVPSSKTGRAAARVSDAAQELTRGPARSAMGKPLPAESVQSASQAVSPKAARPGATPQYGRPAGVLSNKEKRLLEETRRLQDIEKAAMIAPKEDGITRAVWKLQDASGNTQAYLKYGMNEELARTKWFGKIMKESDLQLQFKLIEVEYPQVIAESVEGFKPTLRWGLKEEFNNAFSSVRSSMTRMERPFVLTKVDDFGLVCADLPYDRFDGARALGKQLRGQPVTKREWAEIKEFYQALNAKGFYHEDLAHNLHLLRKPDGKLKITLMDFERLPHPVARNVDMQQLDMFWQMLRLLGLAE